MQYSAHPGVNHGNDKGPAHLPANGSGRGNQYKQKIFFYRFIFLLVDIISNYHQNECKGESDFPVRQ
jgi:hypothetical protein